VYLGGRHRKRLIAVPGEERGGRDEVDYLFGGQKSLRSQHIGDQGRELQRLGTKELRIDVGCSRGGGKSTGKEMEKKKRFLTGFLSRIRHFTNPKPGEKIE